MKNLNKKIGVVVLSGLMLVGGGLASSASASSASAYNIPSNVKSRNVKFLNEQNPNHSSLSNFGVLEEFSKQNGLPFEILEINPEFGIFDYYYWWGPQKSFKDVERFMYYYWSGESKGLHGRYLFDIGGDKVLIRIP